MSQLIYNQLQIQKSQTKNRFNNNLKSTNSLPMTEYTETQAYKHLLQVSENIIYSSDVDQEILKKYEQLKKSIFKKITKYDHHSITLVATYKLLVENAIKTVQGFEEQLENQMERSNFNSLVISLNEAFEAKVSELEGHIETQNNTKTRLLQKQQLNALKDQFDQLDSKFQNLGLLIEVHKKMHEIILQATKAQQKKSGTQNSQRQRIKILENQLQQIGDAKSFIEQHRTTSQSYSEFKMASKALKKILFSQFK